MNLTFTLDIERPLHPTMRALELIEEATGCNVIAGQIPGLLSPRGVASVVWALINGDTEEGQPFVIERKSVMRLLTFDKIEEFNSIIKPILAKYMPSEENGAQKDGDSESGPLG